MLALRRSTGRCSAGARLRRRRRCRCRWSCSLRFPVHRGTQRVAGVDGDTLRPSLVRRRTASSRRSSCLRFCWFSLKPVNSGNGRASSNAESVGLVNRFVPSNPWTWKNGLGSCWSQSVRLPPERHVALRLEGRGRLVVAAEVPLDVVAAAARVGHVERDMPRQLALDAGRELVHVRHDEVRVREARIAAEERERAERASRGILDPVRPGIPKHVSRRAAAVIRRDDCVWRSRSPLLND